MDGLGQWDVGMSVVRKASPVPPNTVVNDMFVGGEAWRILDFAVYLIQGGPPDFGDRSSGRTTRFHCRLLLHAGVHTGRHTSWHDGIAKLLVAEVHIERVTLIGNSALGKASIHFWITYADAF